MDDFFKEVLGEQHILHFKINLSEPSGGHAFCFLFFLFVLFCLLFLLSSFNVHLCFLCSSDVPFSGGNITFSLLTPEPNLRPGYNDFYNNPALQKMVHATQVRIHLRGQYHTGAARVLQRHRYYAINEITISGRWGVTNIHRDPLGVQVFLNGSYGV